MNRTIKFRGKSNGEWVYGSLCTHYENEPESIYIIDDECTYHKVDKESVGQFIGLTDKNGKEIYEGDFLKMQLPISINGTHRHIVNVFSEGYAFWFKTNIYPGFTDCLWFHYNSSDREIIGNIHENPELLEK
jgi:uncharacterized phage protein (TIGR01671 family)